MIPIIPALVGLYAISKGLELKSQIEKWKDAAQVQKIRLTDAGQELFKIMCENWLEEVRKGSQLKIVQELSFSWEDTDYSDVAGYRRK